MSRGIRQASACLASSSRPMIAVREPAGNLDRDPVQQGPPGAALERHVLEGDLLLDRRQEVGPAVLLELGRRVRGTRRSPSADRLAWRIVRRIVSHSSDRMDQARRARRSGASAVAARDPMGHERRCSRAAQRQRSPRPRRAGRWSGSIRPSVMIRRDVGLAEPFQVLVEPLLVEVLHAVDPDRPEQRRGPRGAGRAAPRRRGRRRRRPARRRG